jgi:hypothetical protein
MIPIYFQVNIFLKNNCYHNIKQALHKYTQKYTTVFLDII